MQNYAQNNGKYHKPIFLAKESRNNKLAILLCKASIEKKLMSSIRNQSTVYP